MRLRNAMLGVFWVCLPLLLKGQATVLEPKVDSLEVAYGQLVACGEDCFQDLALVYDELVQAYLLSFAPQSDSVARAALAFAEAHHLPELELSACHAIAYHAVQTGHYDIATRFAERGFQLSEQTGSTQYPVTLFWNTMGLVEVHLERFEQGADYFLKIIEYLEGEYQLEDPPYFQIFKARLNLGSIYGLEGQLDKALTYHQKGLSELEGLLEKNPDDSNILTMQGSFLGSIGRMLYNKSRHHLQKDSLLEVSKEYLFSAAQILQKSGFMNNVAVAYSYLGELYTEQDSLGKAESYLQQSLALRREYNLITFEYMLTCINIGRLQSRKKNYASAIGYLDEAISMGEELESFQLLATAYREKSVVLQEQGKYQEALEVLQQFVKTNEQHQNKKQLEKINALSMQYQRDHERQLTEKEEALAGQQRTRRYALLFSLILAMVFLLIYFYMQRRRVDERNRLVELEGKALQYQVQQSKEELKLKSTELTNFAKMLSERSRVIADLQEKLTTFEKENNISLAPVLKSLHIQQAAQSDIDRFQTILSEVNEEFFLSLSKHHPALTEPERRLAAMVNLGWPATQIASLENTNSSTIRTRKSRLKKKLGVNELESYLSNL